MNFRKIFFNVESLIFITSQFLVGFLNYLFQVYASHSLTTIEFGSWTRWLAQFSVACFAGVWLQSLSSIAPFEHWLSLKRSRILLPILCTGLFLSFITSQESLMFVFGWLGSSLSGFWFGVHLRIKQMKLLAVATILGHSFKFAWVAFDHGPWSFYRATTVTPMIICMVFLLFSRSSKLVSTSFSKLSPQLVIASLSLAFFSTWVPQVDLLVTPRILSEVELGTFAKVALLYKGFYFGFQVLAQLLLAHQVQSNGHQLDFRHFALLAGLGSLTSAAGVFVASFLGWPFSWAPLSLLHITTLCLLFLGIQDLAARHRGSGALALCLLSVFIAFIGAHAGFSIEYYWVYAISCEAIAVLFLTLKNHQKSGPH